MLYEGEEAEFKLPFGQEEKAVGSSEEEEEEEKKPEAKAGSGGFMSKFSLAGICNICNMHITCITEAKAGSGGVMSEFSLAGITTVYVNILSNIIIIHHNIIIISL